MRRPLPLRPRRRLRARLPRPLADAVRAWVACGPGRDAGAFLRAAAREKLERDGIRVREGDAGGEP